MSVSPQLKREMITADLHSLPKIKMARVRALNAGIEVWLTTILTHTFLKTLLRSRRFRTRELVGIKTRNPH